MKKNEVKIVPVWALSCASADSCAEFAILMERAVFSKASRKIEMVCGPSWEDIAEQIDEIFDLSGVPRVRVQLDLVILGDEMSAERDLFSAGSGAYESVNIKIFDRAVRAGEIIDWFLTADKRSQKAAFLTIGPYEMNASQQELRHKNSSEIIRLTEKERDILQYLYEAYPKQTSRQDLLDHVWGYGENIETHTLETHIYRLRQKIEAEPAMPTILVTENDGYKLMRD